MSAEIMTESETGGKKGSKLARYDLIPPLEWGLLLDVLDSPERSMHDYWEGKNSETILMPIKAARWAVETLWEQKGLQISDVELLLAEHYGKCGGNGSPETVKYEDNNWQNGYDWSLSYSAGRRHLQAWRGGEDIDEETGSLHLIAFIWHCLCLTWFFDNKPEFDNRK